MGTINYGTSDYITVGFEPFDFDEFVYEDEDGEEQTDYDGRYNEMEFYREAVEAIREKYEFCYYHVEVKPGYYEGFYIDIESNYGLCYDSCEDKREAQKEITQIKRFLLECVDVGCVQCFPGWCMGYATHEKTLAGINEAVKAMREEVRITPTWWTCERKGIEV